MLKDLEPVSAAIAAAQAAVSRLWRAANEGLDANCWFNGGYPGAVPADEVLKQLGHYCTQKSCAGETLFIKARELKVHVLEGRWIEQVPLVRVAYCTFSLTARLTFQLLVIEQEMSRRMAQFKPFTAVDEAPANSNQKQRSKK